MALPTLREFAAAILSELLFAEWRWLMFRLGEKPTYWVKMAHLALPEHWDGAVDLDAPGGVSLAVDVVAAVRHQLRARAGESGGEPRAKWRDLDGYDPVAIVRAVFGPLRSEEPLARAPRRDADPRDRAERCVAEIVGDFQYVIISTDPPSVRGANRQFCEGCAVGAHRRRCAVIDLHQPFGSELAIQRVAELEQQIVDNARARGIVVG